MIKYLLSIALFGSFNQDPVEMLRTTLHEVNATSPTIEFAYLNDHREMIPTIAEWQYHDWKSYDASLTMEKLIGYFEKQLSGEELSLTIVALKEGVPVGSISLDSESEPEMADFGEIPSPWLGTFHVISEERKCGIGTKLGNIALSLAKQMGFTHVNFFTSNFSNVAFYVENGAKVVETRPFRGHTITIMQQSTNPIKNEE